MKIRKPIRKPIITANKMNILKIGTIITKQWLLTQDFETKDGIIKVVSERTGGGWTVGTTYYTIYKNENEIGFYKDLAYVYEIVYKHLKAIN